MRHRHDYFPALTGMRWLAATMVFLVHYQPFPAARVGEALFAFVHEFHTGVTIFFVLSGFLICLRYEDDLLSKKIRLRGYFVNRVARIYPVYLLLTIVAFIPFVSHNPFNLPVFVLNITFLRGLFDDFKFTGLSVGWSLTVEETFYLFFPLMVLLSRRISYVLQFFIFFGAGLIIWMFCRKVSFYGLFSSLQFLFEYTFFGRCFEFYCGILLAQYIKKNGLANRVGSPPFFTIVSSGWIIACIAGLAVNTHLSTDKDWFLFFETLLNNFLLPPGIVLLFYGLLTEKSWSQKVLSTPFFEQLGKNSYCFYLIHLGPLLILMQVLKKPVFAYIVLQFIAYGLYSWVERPLQKLIRQCFSPRPTSSSNPDSVVSSTIAE